MLVLFDKGYSFKIWDIINRFMPIIYKITNTLNDKKYIGFTSKSIEERWRQHLHQALIQNTKTHFYNAIRKYGELVWKLEIIDENSDYDYTLKILEGHHISQYDSNELYNTLLNGGMGGITSTSFKKGCVPSIKGKKMPIISESKKKYWEDWRKKNPNYKDNWKKYIPTGISQEDKINRSKRISESNKKKSQCPHCNKIGQHTNMVRWHFQNCKFKNNGTH